MRNYEKQTGEILRRFENRKKSKKNKITIFISAAVCLVIVSVFMFYDFDKNKSILIDDGSSTNEQSKIESSLTKNDTQEGIYIPIQKVEPMPEGIIVDMIGLVVYDGKVYTPINYQEYSEDEKNAIIGEYLGEASGTIDEFSLQDEYDENLASNFSGSVYTMKDFNKNFRICIVNECDGVFYVHCCETMDGAYMHTGEDLYGEKRLNLKEDYVSLSFQQFADWNSGTEIYKTLDMSVEEIDELIDVLCSLKFEELDRDIFDYERDFMIFEMQDGSKVSICIFENGYAMYQIPGSKNIGIKLDEEILSKIYSAIK